MTPGTRAALFCPGRGSYSENTLKSLPPEHSWVRRADELRVPFELPKLTELDGAERFSRSVHLRPANVSPLIYVASMIDAEEAQGEHEIVCVGGNSLGWYTALAVAGALSFEDGFRLVQVMSLLQEGMGADGGQIVYPTTGDDWRPDEARIAAIDSALATAPGAAYRSIDFGGYAVLAGNEVGLAHLIRTLPPVEARGTRYPFRLVQHGPYHTPLAVAVAQEARERLTDLAFGLPRVTVIDGRGARFTPWSTDTDALRDYTLGAQVTTPYGFSTSVRVALREYAPERLVLPGPGNSLGGACGQVIVAEGWRGVRSRADFDAVQESDAPIVESMRR